MARQLSTKHLEMYLKGGRLNPLFREIQADPELSFEIRQQDKVIIYFNKKAILTVREGMKFETLDPGYYSPDTDTSWLTVDWTSPKSIRKYFRNAKECAYKQSRKIEFQMQQNVALGNRSFNNRFVVVDMEWQFSQKEIPIAQRISRTRIDLVLVDTHKNGMGKNDIYLAELKLGTGATEGKSGMQDHVDKTYEICCCKLACEALITDVRSIIEQKYQLGIINGTKQEFDYDETPKMMFILGYRGDAEREELESDESKLRIPGGMERPVFIYHNTLITLA